MRKLFILFVAFFAATTLWAYDFKSGDLYYTSSCNYAPNSVGVTNEDDGTMQVSHYHDLSVVTIHTNVFYNTISYNVVRVDDYAFYDSPSLRTVKILKGITSIGVGAFQECKLLETITLPNTITRIDDEAFLNTAFYNDESNWENGVLYIGDCLIKAQPSLSGSYTIKDGTRVIAAGAFRDCSLLESIIIPESIETIPTFTFKGCTSLTSVSLPNSVKQIQNNAFENCSSLSSISIPESVEYIGSSVFKNTAMFNNPSNWIDDVFYIDDCLVGASTTFSKTSISIPSNIRLICQEAFYKRTSLQTLTIPANLTHIGLSAFHSCTNLSEVYVNATTPPSIFSNNSYGHGVSFTSLPTCYIPYGTLGLYQNTEWANQVGEFVEGTTIIGDTVILYTASAKVTPYKSNVFGANIVSNTFENGRGEIIFDAPVTSIGDYAFYKCQYLQSITIPNSVTSIGNNAFYETNLSSITIPESVTSIGNNAFSSCKSLQSVILNGGGDLGWLVFSTCDSLTTVVIGNNVTSFNKAVFYNCSSLSDVTIGKNVKFIGADAFYGCNSLQKTNYTGTIGEWCEIEFSRGTYISASKKLESNPLYFTKDLYINDTLVTNVNIPEGTKYISDIAFYGCKSIEHVTIPNSVKTIGDSAFYNATKIDSIVISSEVDTIGKCAFYGCDPYAKIFIQGEKPASIIGSYVVHNNQIILVPNVDTYIAAWPSYYEPYLFPMHGAFREITTNALADRSAIEKEIGVNNLQQVHTLKVNGTINSFDIMILRNRMPKLDFLDLSNAKIIANAYEYATGCCSKNDTLTTQAFTGTETKILSLKLPKTLNYIAENIINNNLQEITINNGVLANKIFQNITGLVRVNLSDSVTIIPDEAFDGCTSLASINLPETLSSIGKCAFRKSSLESIIIPANVSYIGEEAFAANPPGYNNSEYVIKWYDYEDNNNDNPYKRQYKPTVNSKTKLKSVTIPKGSQLKSISKSAFAGQINLQTLNLLGENIEKIEDLAFLGCGIDTLILPPFVKTIGRAICYECNYLKHIVIPNSVTSVGNNAFIKIPKLNSIQLPKNLTTIEHHAFADCNGLSVIDIPGLVTSIGNYAFKDCNINTIYTYLFDPFTIGQNTFSAYVNANATLYVPNVDDVEMKYLYDTQWSQILKCQRMDRTFEYRDFYANGDVVIGENDESLNGNPNANLNPGSGLVVEEGENTQKLGNVTLSSTVQDWASLIAGCNTNVDTLVLSLTVAGHKWHFMGFPFPVKIADIQSDYQYAIFEYDGELRAAKDTTGWKAVPKSQDYLEPGHGYIIQFNTPSDCSIIIKVNQPNFCDMVDEMNLKVYPSDKTRNKSWNYVSNPYFAYYDINDLNYTGPITFWDVQTGTYQTFRAGDDDYILSPYEAFFLQNTDETGQFNLVFDQTKGMTKKQSQEKQSQRMIAKRNNSAEENLRSVINITLSDGNNSDATRVVINEEASLLYDMGADAAKFMSTERVPQIFSYDSEHGMCAINERPMGNGTIDLGIKLPQVGTYFFSCTRMDTTFYLLDREMNITHDFTYGDYYFDAKAGTNSSRFALIRTRQNVSTDVENTTHATLQTNSDGIYVNGNAYLQIYNVAGALLLEGNMSGHVHLMPGVYMVVNNGVTSKHVIK